MAAQVEERQCQKNNCTGRQDIQTPSNRQQTTLKISSFLHDSLRCFLLLIVLLMHTHYAGIIHSCYFMSISFYIVFYISYHFKSIGKKNLCVSQYSPFFIFCLQLLTARFFILPESFGVLPPVLCLPMSIAP